MKERYIKATINTIFTCLLSHKVSYQLLHLGMLLTYHKSRWVKEMLNLFLMCVLSQCI